MMETLVRGHYKNTSEADGDNVGDGTIGSLVVEEDATTETWILTCTAESADAGTFSVVGSVTGISDELTVAVGYDNGQIALTLADGAEDFDEGDFFTIEVIRDLSYNTPVASREPRKLDTFEASFVGDVTEFKYTISGALNTDTSYILEAEKTLSGGELTAKGTMYAPTAAFTITNIEASTFTVTVTSEATFAVVLATV